MRTAAEIIPYVDRELEAIRDAILGLDTPINKYTLDENNNIVKNRVVKLVDTLMLYMLNEDPLLNKNETDFIRKALTSVIFFVSNKEALPIENMTFKMALSLASIIEDDPESYENLISMSYLTMKPHFMLANLDGEDIPEEVDEFEIDASKLVDISSDQEDEIRAEWEKEHVNAALADEILLNDSDMLDSYGNMPDQFYPLMEIAVCAFLMDEKKFNSSLLKKTTKIRTPS